MFSSYVGNYGTRSNYGLPCLTPEAALVAWRSHPDSLSRAKAIRAARGELSYPGANQVMVKVNFEAFFFGNCNEILQELKKDLTGVLMRFFRCCVFGDLHYLTKHQKMVRDRKALCFGLSLLKNQHDITAKPWKHLKRSNLHTGHECCMLINYQKQLVLAMRKDSVSRC